MINPLPVALHHSTSSADIARNVQAISTAIERSQRAGAQLLVTCECALVGYPGATRESLDNLQPCAVADSEDLLHQRAAKAGITLLLGSVSPWADGWSNDLVACGAIENAQSGMRYRKRCLTPIDAKHFQPGTTCAWINVAGWRLGLSICYDLRYNGLWAELAHGGADAFISAAHMAGPDVDPGTKVAVIPAMYATRAAEWATPLALANSAADDRWVESGAWDARGCAMAATTLADDLRLVRLTPRQDLHPWYVGLRQLSLAGPLPSAPECGGGR